MSNHPRTLACGVNTAPSSTVMAGHDAPDHAASFSAGDEPQPAPQARPTTTDWRESAVCRSVDPDLWFPDRGGNVAQTRAAVNLCKTCPVRRECLDDAMRAELGHGQGSRYGVSGGLTPRQRALLDKTPRLGRGQHHPPVDVSRQDVVVDYDLHEYDLMGLPAELDPYDQAPPIGAVERDWKVA